MNRVEKPRLGVRIAIPIVTLVVGLVFLELFLQLFMPLSFSDRLYWLADGHVKARLEPNQPVTNAFGNPVRINNHGFRGPDWKWKPASGTLRVVALGGSSTFCFQVSDDAHTWPALLEAFLREHLKMPVEVLNLALPGYDTSNSKVHYLFSGRAFYPHAVLVYHTWNDMKFFRPIDEAEGTPRSALSGRTSTGTNSSVFTHFFRRFQIARRGDRVLTKIKNEDRENRYTSLEKAGKKANSPVGERAWSWFARNFDDITKFAKSDGVLPILISQATLVHRDTLNDKKHRLVVPNDYTGMTLPVLAHSWVKASERIEEVARRNDTIFVNGFDAVPHDLEHLKDHVHLLDKGTDRLAHAIGNTLLADERFLQLVQTVRR
jgi:hypothetical protein